ncbi:flagellar filament capping protein FliD [Gimesia maris]|uniref:Filament cap protein n=2 Tax=Gimesia maris TaxID=122 RepID=A0ABX5YFH6_9PLAN|nr:flagellar filament capping protein FliD [Gimesia maris]QDU12498.1 Flagellar hook-associated protein 2 [Gimesia maris]QEG14436.1 Flagellar hook-associated protein 2 [Gimesia maris]QGQ32133.1 flagellar filament capping protein FliD [Gimesia maris]
MSGISSGVGLATGLNITEIVDAIIGVQRNALVKLADRAAAFEATEGGIKTLEANLLTLNTSVQKLNLKSTFETLKATSSDSSQFSVAANSTATAASYQLQGLRLSSNHQVVSNGFSDSDTTPIGTDTTITLSRGGKLDDSKLLEELNNGLGVQRGSIRITDRDGQTEVIDLTRTLNIQDVVDEINGSATSIVASIEEDHLVLTDTSSGLGTLKVTEVSGGKTAADLGILQSVAGSTLTGDSVYRVTSDFNLSQINDGNGITTVSGSEDFQITASDASTFNVDLDSAQTIGDVVDLVNNNASNGGKVTAAITSDGKLTLTDNTGGVATTFEVTALNDSLAARELGIQTTGLGGTITGTLSGGLNSVLLRNLNGGVSASSTVLNAGQVYFEDGAGGNATIDFSGVETLDEVINAINANGSIQIEASLNATKTGIQIKDTSAASGTSIEIQDTTGNLAGFLKIDTVLADSKHTVDSGSLDLRYVNENTSLSTYGKNGTAVTSGSIRITDRDGVSFNVSLSDSETTKTVGDVLTKINEAAATAGAKINARLNDFGDGFIVESTGGSSFDVKVEEVSSGTVAASLGIKGAGATGVTSRQITEVSVEATDTLQDITEKINATGVASATIIDDGTAFNSARLSITSSRSGAAGELILESDYNFGFSTSVDADDALIRIGSNPQTSFLLTSSTNSFDDAITGLEIDLLSTGLSPSTINVARDTSGIKSTVTTFINAYNSFVDAKNSLTGFNSETNARGVLNGNSLVQTTVSRLEGMLTKKLSISNSSVKSMAQLGVRFNGNGKLELNSATLDALLADDPDAVTEFFQQEDTGFAVVMDDVITAMTDPFTGTLKAQTDSLQASALALNTRVDELNTILEARRERLIRQFTLQETIVNQLNSQQTALDGLQKASSS